MSGLDSCYSPQTAALTENGWSVRHRCARYEQKAMAGRTTQGTRKHQHRQPTADRPLSNSGRNVESGIGASVDSQRTVRALATEHDINTKNGRPGDSRATGGNAPRGMEAPSGMHAPGWRFPVGRGACLCLAPVIQGVRCGSDAHRAPTARPTRWLALFRVQSTGQLGGSEARS